MACGGCSGSVTKKEILVKVLGREFNLGSIPLYTFLLSIANQFENGKEYPYEKCNPANNLCHKGTIIFINGTPFVDSKRVM